MKNLVIIAGASGEIGQAFIAQFADTCKVIGISRSHRGELIHKNLSWIHVDLTNPAQVDQVVGMLTFSSFEKVALVHSIGVDKFENRNFPVIEPLETLDPCVYSSNVNTYKYLAGSLIRKIELERAQGSTTKLVLSTIGGIADKYGMVFLTSFVESKNIVRGYMRDAVGQYPFVSALVINVSSTITKSALAVRPYADTTYWLTPEEVALRSAKKLLNVKGYREVDIFRIHPGFESDYFRNNYKMFRKWFREVFGREV